MTPGTNSGAKFTARTFFELRFEHHAASIQRQLLNLKMSKFTPVATKKRKLEEVTRSKKPKRRFKKQKDYHSSEDEDDDGFKPVNLGDSDEEITKPTTVSGANDVELKPRRKREAKPEVEVKEDSLSSSNAESEVEAEEEDDVPEVDTSHADEENTAASGSDAEFDSGSESDSDGEANSTTEHTKKPKSKRNDPEAFSTSISRILSTKLSTNQRSDPVLARSTAATATATTLNSSRLEARARTKLRAERAAAKQKGRTTDVLGIERGIAGEVAEKEKQLRKIATRGVVQLFNAFRAAHDRAEEARKEERRKGTVGIGERERKVGEVSKEGFLELIAGKKKVEET